ncbi:hypothetical protein GCM10023083_41560 [Streptomyces phyllanthi]
MVPTLDLPAQNRGKADRTAPLVAVCSLENGLVLNALGVRATTNPIQLTL